MTTITRERLEQLANFRGASVTRQEEQELARIALASLDAGSNSHPAHGPVSLDRLHRIREILGKAAAQSGGGNLGYAMSDAVKAIDELLEVRKAEPVAWTDEQELRDVEKDGLGYLFTVNPITPHADPRRVIKLYRHAQPEPVVPEAKCDDDGNTTSEFDHGWNACRAAMLQGSQPVSNRDELREQVRREHAEWSDATFGNVGPVGPLKHLSKEALEASDDVIDLSEWADMQFLLWDAQRRAGICDGEITAAMEEKLKVNMARQWPEPKDGEPRFHIKKAPQQEG